MLQKLLVGLLKKHKKEPLKNLPHLAQRNKMGQFFSGSTHNLLVIRTLLPP